MRKEIQKLKFEGDLPKYVEELSQLMFSAINNTCDDFRTSFRLPALSSGLMLWVFDEMKAFCQHFKFQVFKTEDFRTMARCLEIAKIHCTMVSKIFYFILFYFLFLFYLFYFIL